ncbi:unnamed protein product [Psylliodes chrysocephalus]|uniref:O-acyltransferase WSD1 C-terminal domain-containing protein n=1 Tax=Psylliodes chrysocephalus TaxID=3402493 RepID=A0A9P0DA49_9CUCU|nr:unnamed protein product [Psylliodes chrysocephala]
MVPIEIILMSLITFIPYVILLFYLWLLKNIVSFGITLYYRGKIVPLENSDIFWAVGENYHNLINLVLFLNGKGEDTDVEKDVKEVIQERMFKHPEKYGKMMCSLNTFLGYPYLLREEMTTDDIVTVIHAEKANYKSMQDLVFSYSNKPMPQKDKLMWEVIIVKASSDWKRVNGIRDDQIPMFIRINHTIADGLCVMNLCAQTLGENNITFEDSLKKIVPKSPGWTKIPPVKTLQELFLFFIVPGYLIVSFLKGTLNKFDGPYTSTKHHIAFRAEKSGDGLLQTIKKLKNDIGDTSFSEIILTAVSASIYNQFQKHYHRVPKSVSLAVVATRDLQPMNVNGVPILKNQFGLVNLEIPVKTGSSSLLHRMDLLKKNSRNLLKSPELLMHNYINFNLFQLIPIPIMKVLFPLNNIWGLISNLPVFPKIVVFNGYEVEDVYFFTPLRDQMGTGFALISYDSRIHLGFIADVASVATKEDCDEIVNDIFTNIDLLKLEVEKQKLNIS